MAEFPCAAITGVISQEFNLPQFIEKPREFIQIYRILRKFERGIFAPVNFVRESLIRYPRVIIVLLHRPSPGSALDALPKTPPPASRRINPGGEPCAGRVAKPGTRGIRATAGSGPTGEGLLKNPVLVAADMKPTGEGGCRDRSRPVPTSCECAFDRHSGACRNPGILLLYLSFRFSFFLVVLRFGIPVCSGFRLSPE